MRSSQSLEVAAEPAEVFDLSQDYSRRLDWDPFLKEARLIGGAERAGEGVRALCVAKNGLAMETRYVSFHPPTTCAVTMTRGPWMLRSFSGAWRFEAAGPGRTRVLFTYSLEGRPRFLTGLLGRAFARDTRLRLAALRKAAEAGTHRLSGA